MLVRFLARDPTRGDRGGGMTGFAVFPIGRSSITGAP
jgi:hypothetical protein